MIRRMLGRLRRLRWWHWLSILVVIATIVRVSLPPILRRIMAAQASQLLKAHVEIGDVDLALLGGGIALEDVAIREATQTTEDGTAAAAAKELTAATPPPAGLDVESAESATPAPVAGTESNPLARPPLIAWKRFAVDLDWLPLFSKTVRLRAVELDAPFVAVDRLESGDINLAALVPTSDADAAPAAEETKGSAWGFGIDSFKLSAGKLRFHDLKVRNEPVEINLDGIEVSEVAIRPGMYGEPARVRVQVKVDEGTLEVDAQLAVLQQGVAVDADIKADHLPVHRSRSYIPNARWTRLEGYLGMALKYRLETEKRNEISGAIAFDAVTGRNDALAQPVLAWKRFDVTIDSLDLIAQDAKIRTVWIDGLSLPVRVKGDDHLPAFDLGRPAAAAPAPPTADEGGAEAKPWRWSVAQVELTDAHAPVLDAEPPLDVGVQLEIHDVRAQPEQPSPVKLNVAVANGTIGLDGTLRTQPPGFDGRLKVEHIDVPTLVAATDVIPRQLLQSATLDTDLTLTLGSSAPTAGDVEIGGTLALRQSRVVGANEKEFMVGAEAIEVALKQVRVPGLMQPNTADAAGAPITVAVDQLRIVKPVAQVTNTADGLVLPQLASSADAAAPSTEASPQPSPAAQSAAPGVEMTVGTLQVSGGQVGFTDRTVTPYYVGSIASLTVDAREIRWPNQAVGQFRVNLTTPPQGTLDVRGSLVEGKGSVDVKAHEIGLLPFNPYSMKFSPFSIGSGALTLTTKAKIDGKKYGVSNAITLQQFDLGGAGGDSLFQEQFGIPLSLALSLLRDINGNIVLDIPVEMDEKGTSVGIATIATGALRRALVNALASPLKLFGAVLQDGKVQALAPPSIAFRPGRDELAAGADAQLQQLGAFLTSRPAVALTLSTAPTARDARWLKEQALRAELEEPSGLFGRLRALGQRDVRRQIIDALAARGRDEEGRLDGEAAETLERWLAERPDIAVEKLRALAEARVTRIESTLRAQPGVGAERITRGEIAGGLTEDQPVVRLTMGQTE